MTGTTGQLGTPLANPGLIALGGTDPSEMTLIMRALANAIDVAGFVANVYDFPVESVTVPAVVVGWPESIDFVQSFSPERDTWEVPVWFMAGKSNTEDARNAVSDALNTMRQLLNDVTDYDVHVTGASIAEVSVSGVAYLAAKFDCEVYG